MTTTTLDRPAPTWLLLAPFFMGSVLVVKVIFLGVPLLAAHGVPPLAAWMILAPPFVFLPVAVYGAWLLREERPTDWRARLWLTRPTARDWAFGAGGVAAIAVSSAALAWVASALGLAIHPPGVPPLHGLTQGTAWIVAVWLVYWPLNMVCEELTWRGVLLPRMEARFGAHAWAVNASLWLVFHLAFGPGNLLVLIPTLVIVPWVTQRRRNTWLGLLLHAALSLPGFVAMGLGAV